MKKEEIDSRIEKIEKDNDSKYLVLSKYTKEFLVNEINRTKAARFPMRDNLTFFTLNIKGLIGLNNEWETKMRKWDKEELRGDEKQEEYIDKLLNKFGI